MIKRFYVVKNIVTGEMFSACRAIASPHEIDPNSPTLYATESSARNALKRRKFLNRSKEILNKKDFKVAPVDLLIYSEIQELRSAA